MNSKTRNANKTYFNFLQEIVDGGNSNDRVEYGLLLNRLHDIEFYSLVPNDDNRGEDGKKLRKIFCDNSEGRTALSLCPEDPCSVLEMLIGLSYRMENELADGPCAQRVDECFWMLMCNLELNWCDDYEYHRNDGYIDVDDRIRILLDRTYSWDGSRGLFPLRNPKEDQRNVEIWYQMAAYLQENFEF